MSDRLRNRKPDWGCAAIFCKRSGTSPSVQGLDVSLVMGLIQVESAFRKFAVSSVGARGYMQVMPFWTRVIGDGDPGKLFHMQTNLRFGCVILRHYIDRERATCSWPGPLTAAGQAAVSQRGVCRPAGANESGLSCTGLRGRMGINPAAALSNAHPSLPTLHGAAGLSAEGAATP